MPIIRVNGKNVLAWAGLCNGLWPHHSVEEMIDGFNGGQYTNEYLYKIDNEYVGFISLSLRNEYVEGKTDSKPVGYLEGIYVKPKFRRKGIAVKLVEFAKEWALDNGCSMLASDCELENDASRNFHKVVGFTEEAIIIHFTMKL